MSTSDKQVLRWVINENDQIKEAKRDGMSELVIRAVNKDIPKPERIFVDSNGWHCLVNFNIEDSHYFHHSSTQSLLVSKLHGHKILSVGWAKNTERYISKEVLVGTSKGFILELTIEYDASTDTMKHNCNKVFDVSYPVFGIEYVLFSGVACKISVFIACPNHFFQILGDTNESGKPGFLDFFQEYRKNPGLLQKCAIEFPGKNLKNQLQVYHNNFSPDSFAVMSGAGMFYAKMPSSSSDKLYVEQLTPLENSSRPMDLLVGPASTRATFEVSRESEQLVGIGITKEHVYFFTPHKMNVFSKITQKVVHSIEFEKRQGYEIIGVYFEQASHSFFAWSNRFVYQILVENEDRDVWKYFIEVNNYIEAIKFCENTNSQAYGKVLGMYAEFLFRDQKYFEAAQTFVRSEKSFEEITLKLCSIPKALEYYLELKLNLLGAEYKSQKCIISTWLLEIYLDNINQECLDDDKRAKSEQKLHKFLETHRSNLDEDTTCSILQSHGNIEDWVFYADLIKKPEIVILHHINQSEFKKALNKLEQLDPNGKEALLCKYAPIFMKSEPKRVVEMLIEITKTKKGEFDFKKIIPTLMNVDQFSRSEALKLEKFLINEIKIQDKSIHNLYLFHLAESEQEKELVEYLKGQSKASKISFDSEYALSVLKRNGKIESLIYLYSLLNMHSEAVTTALEIRKIDLAKFNASNVMAFDEKLSRKLWLQIANHHIKANNVREALVVMNESKLIKMEELLPFFNEQESISTFKEDICKSLSMYKARIDELNNELNESKMSQELVKKELRTIKERCIEIEGMQTCDICLKPVMKSAFYVFPCAHTFHRECLLKVILPVLKVKDSIRHSKISSTLIEIASKEGKLPAGKSDPGENKESIRDMYKRLNSLLAPRCYYCSSDFIESIYDDLIEDLEEERMWEIEQIKE